MSKTRILLLFPHMVTPGGALNYALRLAELLLERGATVAILTMRAEKKTCRIPPDLKVISLDGPLTSSLGYWLFFPLWQHRIRNAITDWGPDVLVPQVFPANWWGWLYKRRHPGMKLAWVCHEPSAFIHSASWIKALTPWWKSILARGLRPFLTALDVSLSRYSDRIIANSSFTGSEMVRVYGIKPDGIAYPGIDFAGLSGERIRKGREIITAARLTKFKRVSFLLDIFRELLKIYPDLIYHIVGTGEDEASLRDIVKRLGLGSRVVFHGEVDGPTLTGLYRRSILFLHGSISEPFGMAPLEAIACGTPVVAHKSGGPVEFVNENCGRLVASLDVEDWVREIAAYLDFLFSHEDFPDQVRECARNFDWPITLQPAVDTIAGLCAEGAQAP